MSELTDRYVGATLRSIPESQRADIEAELRASIDDAVEARLAGGEESAAAEKDVLTALGDPDRLAADYAGRPGYLIGPDHFFDYKRLVSVLLVTSVPIAMAVILGVELIVGGEDFASGVSRAIGTGITVTLHIVFWTTLVFALIERSDAKPVVGEWTLDSLPAHSRGGDIKLSETIASLVFLVLAINVMILSRTVSPVVTDDGSSIPIFDPAVWDFWFPFLIGVLALEILFEIVKYRVGRWTWSLASFNLALNAMFAIPAVYLLVSDRLFNPDFLQEVPIQARNADWVIVALIVVAVAVEVIQGFRKAYLARC